MGTTHMPSCIGWLIGMVMMALMVGTALQSKSTSMTHFQHLHPMYDGKTYLDPFMMKHRNESARPRASMHMAENSS
jgi:hypothetical protein